MVENVPSVFSRINSGLFTVHGETNGGLKEDYPGEANGRLKIDCRGTRAQEITIDVKVPAEKQNVRPSLCNGDLVKEDFDKSYVLNYYFNV